MDIHCLASQQRAAVKLQPKDLFLKLHQSIHFAVMHTDKTHESKTTQLPLTLQFLSAVGDLMSYLAFIGFIDTVSFQLSDLYFTV